MFTSPFLCQEDTVHWVISSLALIIISAMFSILLWTLWGGIWWRPANFCSMHFIQFRVCVSVPIYCVRKIFWGWLCNRLIYRFSRIALKVIILLCFFSRKEFPFSLGTCLPRLLPTEWFVTRFDLSTSFFKVLEHIHKDYFEIRILCFICIIFFRAYMETHCPSVIQYSFTLAVGICVWCVCKSGY